MSNIKITLIKSSYGRRPNQGATLKALGLRKINSFVIRPKNEAILGMVRTVNHLIKTEDIS